MHFSMYQHCKGEGGLNMICNTLMTREAPFHAKLICLNEFRSEFSESGFYLNRRDLLAH